MLHVVARRKIPEEATVARARTRRGWGHCRQLPSGRWQASYKGPDTIRRTAPVTFDSKMDAEAWLAARHREIVSDDWQPPVRTVAITLNVFADRWLTHRELKPRTRDQYQRLLEREILPG